MPASSPGCRSMTSRLKPRRSVQRMYMRMSISAQSCDSVPPAPGWIVTIAFLRSSSPESIVRISPVWTSRAYVSRPRVEVRRRRLRPGCAQSSSTPRSSVCFRSDSASVRSSSRRRRRCRIFCAAAWSFQKSGATTCAFRARSARARAGLRQSPLRSSAARAVRSAKASDLFVERHGQVELHPRDLHARRSARRQRRASEHQRQSATSDSQTTTSPSVTVDRAADRAAGRRP